MFEHGLDWITPMFEHGFDGITLISRIFLDTLKKVKICVIL
ncbi:hypothetical protein [Pseudanabaena yagii]|nr:hypothetical protein [Pseudanabaena yagii]